MIFGLAIWTEDAIALTLHDGDASLHHVLIRGQQGKRSDSGSDIVEKGLLWCREREVVADESIARGRWLVFATLEGLLKIFSRPKNRSKPDAPQG